MILGHVVILAIIQGIAEFLPISSSGHLVIFENLFGFSRSPVAFDVLLHLGSLVAIVFFLKKVLLDLILNWKKNLGLITSILVGSLPAGLLGFLFKKPLEETFNSLKVTGISYLVTALLLFSTKLIQRPLGKRLKSLKEINFFDAIQVGLFQALAILPGISRSGATIIVGLWLGLSATSALIFSFFLAVPAILGASLLELPKIVEESGGWQFGLLGLLVSTIASYLAIITLGKTLRSKKLFLFGWYCLFLGIILVFR